MGKMKIVVLIISITCLFNNAFANDSNDIIIEEKFTKLIKINGGFQNIPWGVSKSDLEEYFKSLSINYENYNYYDKPAFYIKIVSEKYSNKEDFSEITVHKTISEDKNGKKIRSYHYVFLKDLLIGVELNISDDKVNVLNALKRKYLKILKNKKEETYISFSFNYRLYKIKANNYEILFKKDKFSHIFFQGKIEDKNDNKRIEKIIAAEVEANPLGSLNAILEMSLSIIAQSNTYLLYYDAIKIKKYNIMQKLLYKQKKKDENVKYEKDF